MLSNLVANFCEPDTPNPLLEKGTGRLLGGQEISIGGGIWLEKEQCKNVVYLSQAAMSAGVVAATLLQFIGALQVREYGKRLAVKDLRDGGFVRVVDESEERDVGMGEKGFSFYRAGDEGGERVCIGGETSNVRI